MINLLFISGASVGILGLLFGAILAFAAKKFKVEHDPRIEKIEEILPGANCGACGFAGCLAYAAAIVEKGVPITACAPGGNKIVQAISKTIGKDAGVNESCVAEVRCKGDKDTVAATGEYKGVETCFAVHNAGGDKACAYGCLGYGDCEKICPFNAIHVKENGLPEVDEEKCTGCGLCVSACPRNIIELVPRDAYFFIKCVSKDFGVRVSKVCKKGCIGCSICVRVNNNEGITMEENLPVVDYKNFKGDSTGAEKCPPKVIEFREDKRK